MRPKKSQGLVVEDVQPLWSTKSNRSRQHRRHQTRIKPPAKAATTHLDPGKRSIRVSVQLQPAPPRTQHSTRIRRCVRLRCRPAPTAVCPGGSSRLWRWARARVAVEVGSAHLETTAPVEEVRVESSPHAAQRADADARPHGREAPAAVSQAALVRLRKFG